MSKWILTICLAAFLCWPVSAMAGCAQTPTHYPKENLPFSYTRYFGGNIEPNIPNLPPLTANLFNLPSWITVTEVNYATALQVAQSCGKPIADIKIVIPPDCNARPITLLGDPNKVIFKKIVYAGLAPIGSKGVYTGELRIMGENTITVPIVFNVTEKQVLFWIPDCNEW